MNVVQTFSKQNTLFIDESSERKFIESMSIVNIGRRCIRRSIDSGVDTKRARLYTAK